MTSPVATGGVGCTPPTGPGIPADVDCNGCIWSAYSPAPGQLSDDPAYEEWLAAGGKGSVQQQDCYPGPTTSVQYFPPGAAPPPPGVPVAQLGVEAVALLPLPVMATGSAPGAAGRAFAMTFVNLPTFLWVDNAQWHPVSATANDGVKAVTATAVPASVVWTMGDGGSTTCAGPGVAWRPGVDRFVLLVHVRDVVGAPAAGWHGYQRSTVCGDGGGDVPGDVDVRGPVRRSRVRDGRSDCRSGVACSAGRRRDPNGRDRLMAALVGNPR